MQATRNRDIQKRHNRNELIGCLVIAGMFIAFLVAFTRILPIYLAA